jgi:hypothetical protein
MRIIITMAVLLVLSACQIKDPEQRRLALDIQNQCESAAMNKYPIREIKKSFSEPVYENVPTGEMNCETTMIRQPHVVVGIGTVSHKPVTKCTQVMKKEFSHNQNWTEMVDKNKERRTASIKQCKESWCDKNFDDKYWSLGFNDAERCARTK